MKLQHIQVSIFSTLTGGVDYNFGPSSVTFMVGITKFKLSVSIYGDNILETNEQFQLIISSPLPERVVLGNPGQTTITIVDNDGKLVSLILLAHCVKNCRCYHHLQPVNIQC